MLMAIKGDHLEVMQLLRSSKVKSKDRCEE
jgi:hypothetical protein